MNKLPLEGISTNNINCPLCFTPIVDVYNTRIDGEKLYRCPNCDLIFIDRHSAKNIYDLEYFTSEYDKEKKLGYNNYVNIPFTEFLWQKAFLFLIADDTKDKSLLDIGCATGKFLALIKKEIPESKGIDIAAPAIEIARKNGLNVEVKDFKDEKGLYDIVTCWDTIEHIPDINAFFTVVKKLLKSNGIFVFSTPDGVLDTEGYKESLEHIQYFTPKSIHYIAREIFGTEVITYSSKVPEYSTGINRYFILGYIRNGSPTPHDMRVQHLIDTRFCTDDLDKWEKLFISLLLIRESDRKAFEFTRNSLLPIEFTEDFYFERLYLFYKSFEEEEYKRNLRDKEIKDLSFKLTINQAKIAELEYNLNNKIKEIEELKNDKIKTKHLADEFYAELQRIYSSKKWKLAMAMAWIAGKNGLFGRLYRFTKRNLAKLVVSNVLYDENFNPYERINYLKPIPVIDYTNLVCTYYIEKSISFSAITTVFNEEGHVQSWLNSKIKQSIKPSELVIVDGGSTDNTVKCIKEFIEKHQGINIKLIQSEKRLNVAEGRNIAIMNTNSDIIVCIDSGAEYKPDFFKKITLPFTVNKDIDAVFTCYEGIDKTDSHNYFSKFFIPDWDNTDLTSFIPSSRSLAFKKAKWIEAGKYPEWLTLWGEDTLFAINLRRKSSSWGYIREPLVKWNSPSEPIEIIEKNFNYAVGDGESGIIGMWGQYDKLVKNLVKYLPYYFISQIVLLKNTSAYNKIISRALEYKRSLGIKNGNKRRMNLLNKKRGIKNNVLILSGITFFDSGGGQRGTQIALEFIRRKWHCTFVSVYRSYEKSSKKIFFDIDYSLLELYCLRHFNSKEYIQRAKKMLDNTIVILEFPHPKFLPVIRALKNKSKNIKVIYDCIDNWNTNLGGKWYSIETEKEIIEMSDLVIASASSLRKHLTDLTSDGKKIYHIPQGVTTSLFDINKQFQRPEDLPDRKPLILYSGALWGEWFDWELVRKISEKYSNGSIVLIGDYKNEYEYKFSNVYFLGLKPQYMLPAYLKYADCCIIPFKMNEITRHTNPLKIFEYLSMGKPVVTVPLEGVENLPYTYVANNHVDFLNKLEQALHVDIDRNTIDLFIKENSWSKRVEDIINYIYKG